MTIIASVALNGGGGGGTGAISWQQAGGTRGHTMEKIEEKNLELNDLHPREKEGKRSQPFPKEQTQKANKARGETCSLVIREMQIETTRRCHFTRI